LISPNKGPEAASEDAMEEHRIKVKIGSAEFEATGTQESVQRQYEMFMGALSAMPAAKQQAKKPLEDESEDAGDGGADGDTPDSELLGRAFAQDDKGTVSLKALPDTDERDGDALLMILYGFKKLRGLNEVPVTQMAIAARQSGASVERIDRSIAVKKGLFLKAGARRGGKYQLNNPGIQYVERMIRKMFA
jgi:hypothetical protein